MTFTESNSVEFLIRDLLAGPPPTGSQRVAEASVVYTAGLALRGAGWHYVSPSELPRKPQDVFVEEYIRLALLRLNETIAAQSDRADEVLHKLRAIVLSVRSDGLI
jgi:type I restriction enzyme, R subunit